MQIANSTLAAAFRWRDFWDRRLIMKLTGALGFNCGLAFGVKAVTLLNPSSHNFNERYAARKKNPGLSNPAMFSVLLDGQNTMD